MVVFDATIILALLQPNNSKPRDPVTNAPVSAFRERIQYLIDRLSQSGEKIVIPTPALSEVLVSSGTAGPGYLDQINRASVFRLGVFDERAAIEVAAMTHAAMMGGDKRDGNDGSWAKIKYDRQIVAIAKTEGATTIYSDDKGVYALGTRNGITVIRVADLPLPPEDPQGKLQLDEPRNAEDKTVE